MNTSEKRNSPREDVLHPVKCSTHEEGDGINAYLVNQSDSGILIATQQNVEIGSMIYITIDGETSCNEQACKLSCEVVRIFAYKDDALFKYDLGCIIKNRQPI